jgi:putative phage-type endonuclease
MLDQKVRARGIGGSEIAAVAGVNPWSSPLDVWLRKTGRATEQPTTQHMARGTHLGPALAAWYEELTGHAVTHRGAHERTRVCAEHPLVVATPDGIVHRTTRDSAPEAVLECKSPHWRSANDWGEPGTDQIPECYLPQVTWEMAATGLRRADVAALLDGELLIYTVPYDGALFDALLGVAESFWRDYVEADVAPPVDGSKSAREWLLREHPRAVRDVIKGTEEHAAMVRELGRVTITLRDMEAHKECVRQQLMEAIGDHEGLTCAAGKVSWRNNKSTMKTDWQALAMELSPPESLIQKYTTEQPGPRVFRLTLAKGDK